MAEEVQVMVTRGRESDGGRGRLGNGGKGRLDDGGQRTFR